MDYLKRRSDAQANLQRRARTMQGKVKEHWMQLCEQAAVEQDPKRLIELVEEINRMLNTKEQRLEREQSEGGAGI